MPNLRSAELANVNKSNLKTPTRLTGNRNNNTFLKIKGSVNAITGANKLLNSSKQMSNGSKITDVSSPYKMNSSNNYIQRKETIESRKNTINHQLEESEEVQFSVHVENKESY